MRIRKQPRQLPACRDSFLPCSFQEGVGWSGRVECAEGAGLEGHLVAAMAPANAGTSVGGQEMSQSGMAALQMGLVAASRRGEDVEITSNGTHQRKLPAPSNSSFTQEDDDDDDNLTRHYVRRGLRSNGDGVTQNQSEDNNIPVADALAATPKVNLPAHGP